jgi:hypothetical protein
MKPGVTSDAASIDARTGRCVEILADRFDLAVRDQHVGVVESRAGAGEHGRAANQRRLAAPRDTSRDKDLPAPAGLP